jgi:glycosyltransferase involved in cell wall biosynthesis
VSDAVADYLVLHDGVPRPKVRRIYNAVEQRYFESAPRSPSPRFTVLTAGRLVEEKGHRDLLEALAPMLPGGEATLRIAGDGPERGRLVAVAADLGCTDAVELLGFRSDLPALLAEADVFVLPSRMEGFGLALVESMAAGVPVVATRVGGVPEVSARMGLRCAGRTRRPSSDARCCRACASDVRGAAPRLSVPAFGNTQRCTSDPSAMCRRLLDLYEELGAVPAGQ